MCGVLVIRTMSSKILSASVATCVPRGARPFTSSCARSHRTLAVCSGRNIASKHRSLGFVGRRVFQRILETFQTGADRFCSRLTILHFDYFVLVELVFLAQG